MSHIGRWYTARMQAFGSARLKSAIHAMMVVRQSKMIPPHTRGASVEPNSMRNRYDGEFEFRQCSHAMPFRDVVGFRLQGDINSLLPAESNFSYAAVVDVLRNRREIICNCCPLAVEFH